MTSLAIPLPVDYASSMAVSRSESRKIDPLPPRPQAGKLRRIGSRLVALGVGSVFVTAIALVVIAVRLSASYALLAREEVDALILQDLDHITTGVYNLVSAEGEAFSEELLRSLGVARAFLRQSGGIGFGAPLVPWEAVDQFSGTSATIALPRMLVGGAWQGYSADPAVSSPFVDATAGLLGVTVTLFQRMNERGDMLRAATTVRKGNGTRAIGTYIPAVMPDGSKNPVIAAVMDGRVFSGRAVVVDDWYLTAYEALRSPEGAIVGMLYVGQRQSAIESRVRAAIVGTRIGKTGYVYVLSGKGENPGRYIVSQNGARDGEIIWDLVDPDGRYVTRDVVDAALPLKPGELATIRYRWLNPGETEPRWKIARLAYYAPWDWVIGASAYEDELGEYRTVLERGRIGMSIAMAVAGLAIMILGGTSSGFIARGIARPLVALAGSARAYARGEDWLPVVVDTYEEVSDLSSTFDVMTGRIKETMRSLQDSEEKYRGVYENALEGIFRTSFEGAILDANPAMARMLGYPDATALKAAVGDDVASVYARREDREALLMDLRERGVSLGREFQYRRVDGSLLWVSVHAREIRAEDGSTLGIEGLVTDINARKRSEIILRATLAQKDTLLKEVHHRVKNNLQILVSLLELEASEPHDDEGLTILRVFSDRVRAMADIHEMVYQSNDMNSVDMVAFTRNAAARLYRTYRDRFSEAVFRIDGTGFSLGLEQAIPCGLLINEILSNSFRHAFPKDSIESGSILVRFGIAEDGRVELLLSDDGVGMPEGLALRAGARLGITLIEVLSEQIGAKLEIGRASGTSYTVRFTPAPDASALAPGRALFT